MGGGRGGQGKHLDSVGVFVLFFLSKLKNTKNKGRDLGKSPNLSLLFTGNINDSLYTPKLPNRQAKLKQCNNGYHLVSALNHFLTNKEAQENKQEPKLLGKITHLSL